MGSRLTLVSRWSAVSASVTGSSHRARGEQGQDAVARRLLDDGTLVLAVADGAGSAPLAAEGSALAVEAAVALDAATTIEDRFDAAHAALGGDAPSRATTLLVAVFGEHDLCVGHVGDGFVVARHVCSASYSVLVPAPEREYVNETTFLSSTNWRDDLRVEVVEALSVDGVALLTDGLQLVAMELATSTPHAPFFDPLFAWATADGAGDDELESFLSSDRLAARTDDDLTLALAVRT